MLTSGMSLRHLHTFHLPVSAKRIVTTYTIEALRMSWLYAQNRQLPVQLLGEGSNVLFTCDFAGMVLLNRIKGIKFVETADAWQISVGSGENWHNLVCQTLKKGIAGLENLALIPGCVGSAPIQNIGAYGVELQNFCDYVDVLDLNSGEINRLRGQDCAFGYRDSIFKHQYRHGYAITQVGLRLMKEWKPVLNYGDLKCLDIESVTPKTVFDTVCSIRRAKLPNPALVGNAGSFFKNPVISLDKAQALIKQFPDIPFHNEMVGNVKIAAGWLIEQCNLKGYIRGGAAVHQHQALVLVNQHNATSQDVITLARHVRTTVAQRFGILLEPEVRFIGAEGEIDAVRALS